MVRNYYHFFFSLLSFSSRSLLLFLSFFLFPSFYRSLSLFYLSIFLLLIIFFCSLPPSLFFLFSFSFFLFPS